MRRAAGAPRMRQVMGQLHVKSDPFWSKPESDIIGKSYLYLMSLTYQVEMAQWLPIIDVFGSKVGEMRVQLTPYEKDYSTKLRPTSNSEALLNQKLYFVLRIEQARPTHPCPQPLTPHPFTLTLHPHPSPSPFTLSPHPIPSP